jgi:2-aminoadipate transaminase
MPKHEKIRWNIPEGGMFLWIKVPIDTHKLFEEAIKEKIAFVPGFTFYPHYSDEGSNFLRLNFSYASEKDLEEGIKRLSKLIERKLIEGNNCGI